MVTINKYQRAYYIAYDSLQGKSVQYFWNASTSKWEAVEINLPEIPVK